MVFSSIPFLYGFVLVVFAVYYAVPFRLKNLVLLLSSLFFYYYGEPRYCIVMIGSGVMGFLWGIVIDRKKQTKQAKPILAAAVVLCLAPLLFFKYSDFFISNINDASGLQIPLLKLVLPIGISFYTFQILSYIIDVYRGETAVQRNFISFLTYVSLFPQLIAGPIVRYKTVQGEIDSRKIRLSDISDGIVLFCVGLGKKALIANSLAELGKNLSAQTQQSVASLWILAAAFTLQIYFDFSGYSDMAVGLGRMLGFHFPKNFDYPYMSQSITEFWRRWHISLGSWFRDYLYIPMGGSRCSRARQMLNIGTVWLLTGLWHGASWNFVLWGLYFGALLVIEKLWLSKLTEKLPGTLRRVCVLLAVNFGFVLFNAEGIGEAFGAIEGMLGMKGIPLLDGTAVYYLKSFWILIVIAVIGATSLPKSLAENVSKTKRGSAIMAVFEPIFCAVVLLLVTAGLVEGSFNPFLYFRF